MLAEVLRDVVRLSHGDLALKLFDRAVRLSRATRAGEDEADGELERLIAKLDLDQIEVLVRSLTRWFQLVNLAEDNERVRRLRARTLRGRRRLAQARCGRL